MLPHSSESSFGYSTVAPSKADFNEEEAWGSELFAGSRGNNL